MTDRIGDAQALPEIGAVLPHRPPFLLLDGLDHADDRRCRARLRVDPKGWYLDADGALPAWYGLELIAQTIAACIGVARLRAGCPLKAGYLLGTRSYASQVPAFPAGTLLEVEATEVFRDESGLAAFDGTIRMDGQAVAQAQLKVFEEP